MITTFTAAEIGSRLRSRELSVRDVVQAFHDASSARDQELGIYLTLASMEELSPAIDAAQKRIDDGTAEPLTGIPIALKDNISTQGMRTTCGSKILDNYIPPFDAAVTGSLKSAGAIILGKTNLDEFAMGSSNENSAYFPARNPWDLTCSPGGSSGGSAAGTAAGMVPLALGSDTGGSIRQPAALSGVVGYKPTYGRVSRFGLIAFGSSLDQIGPFGHSIEDAALAANAISGHDPLDSTSIPDSKIKLDELKSGSLKGKKLALPKELFDEGINPSVRAKIQESIDTLKREGVQFTEVSIPEIAVGVTMYYIIAPAEASSNLARFDGVRYGARADAAGHIEVISATRGQFFGHEVKTRIMMGTYVLSAGYYDAFYLRAQQARGLMTAKFEKVFQEFDAVLSPTSPVTAFKIGELSQDPMALKIVDYCTIPANMGGFPGLSMPCGLSDGLPVGLQLMGPNMGDEKLLQLAYSVEKALGAAPLRPPAG